MKLKNLIIILSIIYLSALISGIYSCYSVNNSLEIAGKYNLFFKNMLILSSVIISNLMIFFVIIFYLFKSYIKPVRKLKDATHQISNGNLNINLNLNTKKEVDQLTSYFNGIVSCFNEVMNKIKEITDSILKYSSYLKKSSTDSVESFDAIFLSLQDIARGYEEQAYESEKTSYVAKKLGSEIELAVKRSSEVEQITNITKGLSVKSKDIVDVMINNAEETKKITSVFLENTINLNENTKQIRDINSIITTIIKKINLLSLNASIEAAKFGNAGQGFAFIASDMRNLANQSKNSAKLIESILDSIQIKTKLSLETSNMAHKIVDEHMSSVYSVQDLFQEISCSMDSIISKITEMNTSIKKIDDFKLETINSITSIAAVTQESAATSQEICATSENQKNAATEIKEFAEKLYTVCEELAKTLNI
ncbi:UNVERIFIED_CONTAM: methyl-accepting chemotaxis protein [Acetivibrio alkalicellulosi]